MQILVEVANIQVRTLKTEVGKGSMQTAVGHGLVGPKRYGKSVSTRPLVRAASERECGQDSATGRQIMNGDVNQSGDAGGRPREEFSFLLNRPRRPWKRIMRRYGRGLVEPRTCVGSDASPTARENPEA